MAAMPRTVMGYVLKATGLHQAGLAVLSVGVFGLSAVPLEFQRRIVNGLTHEMSFESLAWLAAGYAGVPFSPEEMTVTIGGVKVFDRGVRAAGYDEAAVHEKMKQREYTIAVSVGNGPGRSRFLTCDLTVEYVHINADYST